MSPTYLLSIDTLKTFCQGALGAMTFGAYHQYTTNRMMDLNNEKLQLQNEKLALEQKYFMDKMETQHKIEMNELMEKFNKLEKQAKWWNIF